MVALDLKGFGDSEKPYLAANYKDEIILEELYKFIEVLQGGQIKKIILIGHGLGGQLGWKFIEKYPSMVGD